MSRRFMRSLAAALVAIVAIPAASLHAQQPATIDPGMTRAQVVVKLGEPLSARMFDGYTYMLYRNGCEKECGMNDLVVLDSGKVVDAVFRSSARRYTGTSSSPHMISAAAAKKGPDASSRSVTAPSTSPSQKKPPQ
jgi:hypothetical protein